MLVLCAHHGALTKVTKIGLTPVATGVWDVNAPPEPMVKSEMVLAVLPSPALSTAMSVPVESMAMPVGARPVATGVPVMGVVLGTPAVSVKP